MDKELTECPHPKSCSQWLNVQVEISNVQCPSRAHTGTILRNICINDLESGIECTLSQFANYTKLSVAVDSLEERDAIQRCLNLRSEPM